MVVGTSAQLVDTTMALVAVWYIAFDRREIVLSCRGIEREHAVIRELSIRPLLTNVYIGHDVSGCASGRVPVAFHD